MSESRSTGTPDPAGARRRVAMAGGLFVLAVAIGIGILAASGSFRPAPRGPKPTPLTDVLSATIATSGIDAAVAQYRTLRDRGFPRLRESEADTNTLGYKLLKRGSIASAIQVFQLNAEAHPNSANVYDSLGDAYLTAGDKAQAIESYQKAVAINPRMKSAGTALQTLTNFKRPPLPPMVLFHISAGMLGLLSGAAAMSLRKGSRRHGLAGNVFTACMLSMSGSGAFMALVAPDGETVNVLMGTLTFYLVATAWRTARRRNQEPGLFDWVACLVVSAVGAGLASLAMRGGPFGGVGIAFGAVALFASGGDLRMIARGGVSGAGRIARHLWRMCTALLIGVMSFFLGQPQVFPPALRKSGLLGVPGLLVVILMVFWLIRVLATSKYKRAAMPKAKLALGQVAIYEGTQV